MWLTEGVVVPPLPHSVAPFTWGGALQGVEPFNKCEDRLSERAPKTLTFGSLPTRRAIWGELSAARADRREALNGSTPSPNLPDRTGPRARKGPFSRSSSRGWALPCRWPPPPEKAHMKRSTRPGAS